MGFEETFPIPYLPVDVVLLGAQTLDVLWEDDVVINTTGALANIQRNLTVENYSYLAMQYAQCSIKDGDKTTIFYTSAPGTLEIVPINNWCHICYLDWLNLRKEQLYRIALRTKILTADVARIEEQDKQPTRDLLATYNFDLVFCSDEQAVWVDAKNTFMHAKDWWDVKIGNIVHTYKTTPIDLEFSLGAGDTLVACVLNNCKTVQEIPTKFKEIETELNQRLLDREKWFKGQKLIS